MKSRSAIQRRKKNLVAKVQYLQQCSARERAKPFPQRSHEHLIFIYKELAVLNAAVEELSWVLES